MNRIINKINRMFFWCGVLLFDSSNKEYGGFNHFLAGKIFRWKFSYVEISITYNIRLKWIHEDDYFYYDGYHNRIHIGFIRIIYGT